MAYLSEREALRQIHEGASGTLRYKGVCSGVSEMQLTINNIINQ